MTKRILFTENFQNFTFEIKTKKKHFFKQNANSVTYTQENSDYSVYPYVTENSVAYTKQNY